METEGEESAAEEKRNETNEDENVKRRHWQNDERGTPRAPTGAWRRGGRREKKRCKRMGRFVGGN